MSSPEIVLIAALAEANRVIGRDNRLPWHIPEDMKRFKRLTSGHPMVMGRNTFESLLDQFGGPLPDREHIVLTRNPDRVTHPAARVFTSYPDALAALAGRPRVFIGGGESVYETALPHADRLELTLVEGAYEGDTRFPAYEHLVGPVFRVAREEQGDGFRFVTYVRREKARHSGPDPESPQG